MLRLMIPGGILTSAQLKAIAKVASDLADDFAEFTPSGEIQLQCDAGAAPELLSSFGGQTAEGAPPIVPDHLGVHEQEQAGLFSVAVSIAQGRLSGRQMRKLADLAERHGNGTVRLAGGQTLFLQNLPKEKVLLALEGLEWVDLKVKSSS